MILHVDGGENQWTGNHRRLVAEIVPRQHCSLHVDGIGGLFLTSLLHTYADDGDGAGRHTAEAHPDRCTGDHGADWRLGSGHEDVADEHDEVADDAHPGNGDVDLGHETRVDEHLLDGRPDTLQHDERAVDEMREKSNTRR